VAAVAAHQPENPMHFIMVFGVLSQPSTQQKSFLVRFRPSIKYAHV
jgi:hypothetical protein